MTTVPQVVEAMQTVLTEKAEEAGKRSGFIKREREFSGATFAQMLVFGWLGNPEATVEEMSQVASVVGVEVSRQGVDQRFTEEAAEMMSQVLEEAIQEVVSAEPVPIPILRRFTGVYIMDSSIIQLPDSLMEVWKGSGGGRPGQENAGVKLSVRWDYVKGTLEGPYLQDARQHDQQAPIQEAEVSPGSLRMADLGYFKLSVLEHIGQQKAYWLTRYKAGTAIYTQNGRRLNLPFYLNGQKADRVELSVQLGASKRLPCRLVAQRVPVHVAQERRERMEKDAQREGYKVSRASWLLAAWTVFLTNVPVNKLAFDEVFVVATVRWQIELIFKLWKSEGLIDEWRTTNPWRILCELYAKLIALIIQHWLFLLGCWFRPDRSLTQAGRSIRRMAWALACVFSHHDLLCLFVSVIQLFLSSGARISKSRSDPRTFQQLLQFGAA